MIAGKIWGNTHDVFARNDVSVKLVHLDKGKRCSKHRHLHKHNLFYLVSGIMRIKVWKKDYDLCDETVLYPDQVCVVPPGEFHLFEALQDCVALEVYYVVLNEGDIERETVGGSFDQTSK